MKATFYKFPRTPHLGSDSAVVDDDEVKDKNKYIRALPSGLVAVVQEKVDGTNVSVHFEEPWIPVLQKRAGLIGKGEKKQYQMFADWVNTNLAELWEMLGTKYCLFGEWLWRKHSVGYSELPSYFLAFDVFEKATSSFVCHDRFLEIIGEAVVPVSVVFKGSTADPAFAEAIGKSAFTRRSEYGEEFAEGVYIRFERDGVVYDRVKLRRPDVKGLEVFADHNIENNSLK